MNAPTRRTAWPRIMLVSRMVLFLVMQGLIALVLRAGGIPDAWSESSRWWMHAVLGANLVSIALLVWLLRREGGRLADLLRFDRRTFWKDLAWSVAGFLLAGPIASLPMSALGTVLLGSYDRAIAMLFRPLPMWAILLGFLFPITIAFAELPTYFGYVMPRLEKQLRSGWLAWAIASLFLSLQHATLPLILDGRFVLWRALM